MTNEYNSILIKAFGRSPKLRILDFLLDYKLNDFTKKEIIEALGMSKVTFYKNFKDLIDLGVQVSLGLILFDIKPSTLGFTALRIPFHRDPYHWAPPTRGDPDPQLPLHCFLRVIAVGKPLHPEVF